jgi:hypothetical protein
MLSLLDGCNDQTLRALRPLIELGLNHEQQHQELFLMDMLNLMGQPLDDHGGVAERLAVGGGMGSHGDWVASGRWWGRRRAWDRRRERSPGKGMAST